MRSLKPNRMKSKEIKIPIEHGKNNFSENENEM
jgi:hypothetical protein